MAATLPAEMPADGTIRLAFSGEGAACRLQDSYQAGVLRVRLPRRFGGERPEAVILNTGGGLVGGDRLAQQVHWGAGASATVTGQAAEKVYRTLGPSASVSTRLEVASGANAEWLPQETILFDRARLHRSTEVRIAGDARFLGLEATVLGRTAMGERVHSGELDDRWRIWRDGRLIHADALRLAGAIDDLTRRRAIMDGACAMAVILLVATTAATLIGQVRAALEPARGLAVATVVGPVLIVRLIAREGLSLRQDIVAALAALRGDRALPRVWGC